MKGRKRGFLVVAKMAVFVTLGLFLCGLIGGGDLRAANPLLEKIYEIILDTNNKLVPAPCEGAPVEKTGQMYCYSHGDDGDWEKGVAWPNPRFTDNGDGTVTDNLTGLVWLKNADCFPVAVEWASALSKCNTLKEGECGLWDSSIEGDWRLPNVKELLSLIDYGHFNFALPSDHPFTSVKWDSHGGYWSSTTCAVDRLSAYIVDFYFGDLGIGSKDPLPPWDERFLWCVRGGN
jgi:hypothetical protein